MYERKEKGFVRRSNILKLLIITFKKEIMVLCLNNIWAIRFKVCMNLTLVILSATIFEYTCQELFVSLNSLVWLRRNIEIFIRGTKLGRLSSWKRLTSVLVKFVAISFDQPNRSIRLLQVMMSDWLAASFSSSTDPTG